MATTALFAELVIIGMQGVAWIMLILLILFGLPATSARGGSRAVDISRILTLDVVLISEAGQQTCPILSKCSTIRNVVTVF